MVPGRPTALTYRRNRLTLSYTLARAYKIGVIVRINGYNVGLVLQNNNTSIAARPPVTENHLAVCCCLYRSALRGKNIKAIMPTRGLLGKTARYLALHRPDQGNGLKSRLFG
jgi:hypothetical protein